MTLTITWVDGHRNPAHPPDPRHPEGIDLDLTDGKRPCCRTALPYPAPRCGHYRVVCTICRLRTACTTSGHADDPRTVRVACQTATAFKTRRRAA